MGTHMENKLYLRSMSILSSYHFLPEASDQNVVAAKMGVSSTTYNRWVNGICPIPPEMFVRWYEITGHQAALQLLTPAGYQTQPLVSKSDRKNPCLELMDIQEALGKLAAQHRDAIGDGKYTEFEKKKDVSGLHEIIREAQHMIDAINNHGECNAASSK